MESLFPTRDQALSLWSGSTGSKTLLYQRTNPKLYQIVRTPTEETTWIQDQHHPNTSSTLCRMPHLNNNQKKKKKETQFSADKITTSLSLAHQRKTNKQTKTAQISPYEKLTQTNGPTLRSGQFSCSVMSDSLLFIFIYLFLFFKFYFI